MYYGCVCWTNHWHFSSFPFLRLIEAMPIRTNWTIQALGRQFKAWPTQGCSTEQMYSPEGHYFVQSRAQKCTVPSAEKWTLDQSNIGVWVLAWNLIIDHWMCSPEQILIITPAGLRQPCNHHRPMMCLNIDRHVVWCRNLMVLQDITTCFLFECSNLVVMEDFNVAYGY